MENSLSPSQQQALEMLATGSTVSAIAKAINVTERTIYNWRAGDVDFKAAWEELLATLWENTKVGLKALGGRAIQVLLDIMDSPDATNKEKLIASQTVLMNLHKVVTDDELRKRVEVLIAQMEAQNGDAPSD